MKLASVPARLLWSVALVLTASHPGCGPPGAEGRRIPNGRYVILPASEDTAGHGTTFQARFKHHLAEWLPSVPRR
jgi:homoserine O-acetyltransferase